MQKNLRGNANYQYSVSERKKGRGLVGIFIWSEWFTHRNAVCKCEPYEGTVLILITHISHYSPQGLAGSWHLINNELKQACSDSGSCPSSPHFPAPTWQLLSKTDHRWILHRSLQLLSCTKYFQGYHAQGSPTSYGSFIYSLLEEWTSALFFFFFQTKLTREKLTGTWQIRVSIIKSRLKLGLCATASYFLKCLYFKCVHGAWKIPTGSRWESIILINANGSWAPALKKKHILWAKPSEWQDGNRKTWGGSGGERTTLNFVLSRDLVTR